MIPVRRLNIQATIDPIIVGRKYLVEMWDDEGHKETYRLKAKTEKAAWDEAHFRFERSYASGG